MKTWKVSLGFITPESDIPKQARDLYLKKKKKNLQQCVCGYRSYFKQKQEIIDLTFSASRGMSLVHGQYLKNSGAASSFSVSIIIDDHLWGLVTCQNVEPKHIDLEDRVQANFYNTCCQCLFIF